MKDLGMVQKSLSEVVDNYLVSNFTDDPEVKTPFLERTFSCERDDLLALAKHIAKWQKKQIDEYYLETKFKGGPIMVKFTKETLAGIGLEYGDKVKITISKVE